MDLTEDNWDHLFRNRRRQMADIRNWRCPWWRWWWRWWWWWWWRRRQWRCWRQGSICQNRSRGVGS